VQDLRLGFVQDGHKISSLGRKGRETRLLGLPQMRRVTVVRIGTFWTLFVFYQIINNNRNNKNENR